MAMNSNFSFDDVVTKLEKRFHFPVLEEMALLQLENSEQLPHESLEDWAEFYKLHKMHLSNCQSPIATISV